MNATRLASASIGALLAVVSAAPAFATPQREIDDMAARFWSYELRTNYYVRSLVGAPLENFRTLTLAHADEDAAFGKGIEHELQGINPSTLDRQRRLTYERLRYDADGLVGARAYFWLAQWITPYRQQLTVMAEDFVEFRLDQPADAQRYRGLLSSYGDYIRSLTAFARGQHDRGIILPKAEIDQVVSTLDGLIATQPALLEPSPSRLHVMDSAQQRAFTAAVHQSVVAEVVPALRALRDYVRGPYRVGAPEAVGISQYPGGRAFYNYLVRRYVTLDISPEQIHEIGLEQGRAIDERVDAIRRHMKFEGSLGQFRAFVRSSPEYHFASATDMAIRLKAFYDRAHAAVPRFFDALPKAPFELRPLPKSEAAEAFGNNYPPTAANPRGFYYYNDTHPQTTPAYMLEGIILHEGLPGHHLQYSLQLENTALPPFRRYVVGGDLVGYEEGWAEYASQLGFNMGLFSTDRAILGRLMEDSFVTSRLVADTGMNAMGWSRQRAIDYMHEHTFSSDEEIAAETLRYSTDLPAQALGYKMGELTLLSVRDRLRQRLGSRFSLPLFHQWVLGDGELPLDVLQKELDARSAEGGS